MHYACAIMCPNARPGCLATTIQNVVFAYVYFRIQQRDVGPVRLAAVRNWFCGRHCQWTAGGADRQNGGNGQGKDDRKR